jgi:hypothetical protein
MPCQLADVTRALDALGVTNYWAQTIPGYNHAFANWKQSKVARSLFSRQGLLVFLLRRHRSRHNSSPSPGATPGRVPRQLQHLWSAFPPQGAPQRFHPCAGEAASVMIGGFIVTGERPKKVALRAIGHPLPALAW